MSILFHPGFRVFDDNGKIAAAAKLYIYDAGTTDDADVYSDLAQTAALPQPIVCTSGGLPATGGGTPCLCYVAAGQNYKIEARDSSDNVLWTLDDIPPAISNGAADLPVTEGGTGASDPATARTNLGAAAQSDYTTLAADVANIDGELDGIGGSLGAMAAKANVSKEDLKSGDFAAVVLQEVRATSTTKTAVGAGAFPVDTSVPQNTEGTEVLSVAITPIDAESTLRVSCQINFENGTTTQETLIGIFHSDSASAIQIAGAGQTNNGFLYTIKAEAQYAPGDTDAVTFSVRVSTTNAGTLNGTNYGTGPESWIKVEEIQTPPIT